MSLRQLQITTLCTGTDSTDRRGGTRYHHFMVPTDHCVAFVTSHRVASCASCYRLLFLWPVYADLRQHDCIDEAILLSSTWYYISTQSHTHA